MIEKILSLPRVFFLIILLSLALNAKYIFPFVYQNNILSYDSNPSLLSMHPMQKFYIHQGIWDTREHNFKKHLNKLSSNLTYLVNHTISGKSELEVNDQKQEFSYVGLKTSNILYDIYTKTSSIYRSAFDSYIGAQWYNFGFSVFNKSLYGANILLDNGIKEDFLENISMNKDNYTFWKTLINAIIDNPKDGLYLSKSDITQYSISYANNISFDKSKLHFGASIKYSNVFLYKNLFKLNSLSYEQLMLYMNSKMPKEKFKNEHIWSGDLGVTYQLVDNKIAVGYTIKDFYHKNNFNEKNITNASNLLEYNATFDAKHIISIYYNHSSITSASLNIDLMPSRDIFGFRASQYMDFKLFTKTHKKDKISFGVKKDMSRVNSNLIYTIGYSIVKNNASLDINYQFSEKYIEGENNKQYDILKIYLGYRL